MLVSQINALWQLYIVYGVIYGIGMSIFVPLTSTVAGWFIQRRTLMTGIVVAGIGVGTIVGPPIADLLIFTYEWRESYLILGCVVLGVVVIAAQFLKSSPSRVNKQMKGENDLTTEESKTTRNWFTLKEAITTGQFWMTFSQFICFGFCQSFIVVHIVPHVTDLGISSNYAASVLSTIGALSIVSKIAMGAVGDAIGNKRAFILGFILASLSLVWVMFTKEIWGFYLFAILFGIAYGTHISQQSPFAAVLFGLPSHGVIFGVLALGMAVGATLGPIITGYLFDVTGNYNIAIMLGIMFSILGLILTAILKPTLQSDNVSIPLQR